MAEIKRSTLFGKLNSFLYKSIEGATVFCKMRGNPYVELIHWINQIMQSQDSDLHQLIKHYGLNTSKLASDLTNSLDGLPRGATSISDFSPHLEQSVERAWVYSTLLFETSSVRSGVLIYGILETPGLKNVLLGMSGEFAKLNTADMADNLLSICDASPETRLAGAEYAVGGGAEPGESSGAIPPAEMGKQEALNRFSVDLTAQAKSGKMDPILGRDEEIRQIIDILMRRRQNNPILTGEAGVGKTAVVEGFAQKIVSGDVPPMLKDVTLRTLDLGLLQAGASMKGEFENRLRQVIEEVQASPKPIILFIDEAHTLVGAGGAAGQGDAANLLKPALARGTLRTVAATTWAEYKKYFEKDPALTRRFQVVKVDEPDEAKASIMIRGLAAKLEEHHKVRVLDEAVTSSVSLSHRYIPARQLPDKAVSLIDTACARVAVGQHSVPADLEDSQRRILNLETELRILQKEIDTGRDHGERKAELEIDLANEKERRDSLEARWGEEKSKVEMLLALHDELRKQNDSSEDDAVEEQVESVDDAEEPGGVEPIPESTEESQSDEEKSNVLRTREEILAEVNKVEEALAELQGESPLILPYVDEQAVASVVADWTGVPVGRMVKNEIEAVLNLVENLEKRVVGQTHALAEIAKRIQTSRAGLDNPKKPIGVFMLAGTSGVGKTETALALAETLYGGEHNVITINMSEFQEAHTVSTLKGAPPGYVGYGEGGILTEAVRRRPYSIVLLDEVEKAHPDVHEIFFQVFDKGQMEDGEGRMIDFKNTIILLTTNAGSDLIMSMCKDPELMPDPDGIKDALKEPLLKIFPAALLGRMLTVPFYPLSREVLELIINLQLTRIRKRVESTHKIPFSYGEEVVKLVLDRCNDVESGGRIIDAILTNSLLPAISREFLTRMMEGNPPEKVAVGVKDGDFTYEF